MGTYHGMTLKSVTEGNQPKKPAPNAQQHQQQQQQQQAPPPATPQPIVSSAQVMLFIVKMCLVFLWKLNPRFLQSESAEDGSSEL